MPRNAQALRRLHVVTAQDIADDQRRERLLRGVRYGLSLALPFWILIIALVIVHPHMGEIVKALP